MFQHRASVLSPGGAYGFECYPRELEADLGCQGAGEGGERGQRRRAGIRIQGRMGEPDKQVGRGWEIYWWEMGGGAGGRPGSGDAIIAAPDGP